MRYQLLPRIYRARYLLPMSAPVIEDGAVLIHNGVILDVGKYSDLKPHYASVAYHDLGAVLLLPGLINAHVHLDYTMMRGKLSAGDSFVTWIQKLNERKASLHQEDYFKAIVEGAHELSTWGCTSCCNIESFADLIEKLPPLPLRTWHCLEMMDIRGREQGEQGLALLESLLRKKERLTTLLGISPHAPLTCSQRLYERAAFLARGHQLPFCTHLAESQEELEMFAHSRGPWFDFLKRLGREMSDCGEATAVQLLLKNNLLPRGSLLVHMNFLSVEDRALLAERGADFFVVHCPRTHQFFKRPPFDWKFFSQHGYRLLLGTDSLASNRELNLFAEMRTMAAVAPQLKPEEIIAMVTLSPAAALGMDGKLGRLSRGAFAEMITIPFEENLAYVYQAVLQNQQPPNIISLS